ncbi:hypothetical protein SAMN04487905_12320 [Actinopolyspora xinjiangensis]|uniref:Secreted protein n=1 Tax=Actinopolyspora xinjiangensis TaxID=405564 RepID=A0A1H0X2B5_9ACTN|nr:hypothetical protein SAMN04487905_12320 [Actinopolyspora xinjiangensis]
MRNRVLTLTLSILAILGMATSTASASANDMPDKIPAEVQSALDHFGNTGELTEQEKATIRDYPNIAKHVPDPDAPIETFGTSSPADNNDSESVSTLESSSGSFNNGTGCWITRVGVRKTSLLGNTQFDYMARIDYCANGATVTSVHQKYHYLNNADGVTYLRGYANGSPHVSGVGGSRSDVAIHGFIELCAGVCYASLYLKIDATIYNGGYFEWSARV